MNFKPTYKTGGTTSRKPSKNDRAMVNGVSSILKKIKDKKNRKEVAGSMVKQFNREGVSYNKEKFLKNSRSYQYGGASRADSLDVLANSIAVQNYYSGRRYNPVSRTFGRNLGAFNSLYDTRNYFNNRDEVITPTGIVPPIAVNYYTPIDRNRFRQRETANVLLDTRAPMQLFDRRIEPTGNLIYRNREDNDPMYGDNVDIYTYDPLSVTPWDMLSTQQKKQRINKYGISGTPYKSKQEFIEKTSDPEVIRKQKLLKEAGLYKGAIDGDWGDKSKEAWKKYEESKKTGSTTTAPSTSTTTPKTGITPTPPQFSIKGITADQYVIDPKTYGLGTNSPEAKDYRYRIETDKGFDILPSKKAFEDWKTKYAKEYQPYYTANTGKAPVLYNQTGPASYNETPTLKYEEAPTLVKKYGGTIYKKKSKLKQTYLNKYK